MVSKHFVPIMVEERFREKLKKTKGIMSYQEYISFLMLKNTASEDSSSTDGLHGIRDGFD